MISDKVSDSATEKRLSRVSANMSESVSDTSETLNKQLHDACESGNLSHAQQAVSAGVDVNCLDRHGRTPVMHAIYFNHNAVVDWLLSQETVDLKCGNVAGYGNILHTACGMSDSEDIVTKVATLSDNVNVINKYGYTPVQLAVKKGNVRGVLGLLPVLGVDWQVVDEGGKSLLELAR